MRRVIIVMMAILGLLLANQPVIATAAPSTKPCKNYTMDLMETSLGLWLQGLSIRIKGSDKDYFRIDEVAENSFDPCADLSWVILNGVETTQRNIDTPASEEAEVQTIIFFNKEKLVHKMQFLSARKIKDVQVKGTNATVTYSVKSGKTRATEKVNYNLNRGNISIEAGISNDLKPLELDFERGTLPTGIRSTPLGNVNYYPADQEFDEDIYANIYIGDTMLVCSFFITRRNSDVNCQEIGDPSWPLIKSEYAPNEDAQVDPNGKTNTVRISFGSPSILNTTYDLPGRAFYAPEKFPNDSITRIGPYFVDTHGGTVKISDNYFTVTLSEEKVTAKNEPLIKLDTSRYPDFKS